MAINRASVSNVKIRSDGWAYAQAPRHLLDRGHALGAVEVLASRMPAEVEQRAKSFAGELLAPTEGVAAAWREAGSPRTDAPVRTLILELQKGFGVTKAVATWKLQLATQLAEINISRLLDEIEPMR